jgi:hypothetical protein
MELQSEQRPLSVLYGRVVAGFGAGQRDEFVRYVMAITAARTVSAIGLSMVWLTVTR